MGSTGDAARRAEDGELERLARLWRAWRRLLLPLGVLAALLVVAAAVWAWVEVPNLYPPYQPSPGEPALSPEVSAARDATRSQSIVTTRASVLAALAGVGALVTIVVNVRNSELASRTLATTQQTFRVTERGHLTDRYAKAIEQLGHDSIAIRLGGIYALQQLAVDTGRDSDQATVVEVLSAFVRLNLHAGIQGPLSEDAPAVTTDPAAPAPGVAEEDPAGDSESAPPVAVKASSSREPRPDVLAAISVLAQLPVRDGVSMRADFTGLDFSGLDLSHARLTGADLKNVELTGAGLTHADLTGADLTHANLTHANLTHANLTHANLSSVVLTRAVLARTDLTNADLTRAKLTHANLSSVVLTNADLTYADLTAANLTNADLNDANLINAYLNDADLSSARLRRANLTDANLTDAILTSARLGRADLTRADLIDATLARADLTHANLTNATLTNANLTRADLSRAYLLRADLTRADLTHAYLDRADLTRADLSEARVSDAQLATTVGLPGRGGDSGEPSAAEPA